MYEYKEFMKDPFLIIKQIYEHIAEDLDEETMIKMDNYLNSHPQHSSGYHSYNLREYNLTEDMIADACKTYIDFMKSNGVNDVI